MIAVLINMTDVRLGHVRVSDDTHLIQFGGGYFVRTTDTAVMEEAPSETGVVFAAATCQVIVDLDLYKPTRNFSKRPEQKR